MIYNTWGFFAFYFQVLQKVEEGGKRAWERESKHKEETPGTFSQVKIIPLELFLTLFFICFSFVRCKNNEKNSFKKTEATIYILHPFGSCPCVFAKNVVFSLHVQIILILEVFLLSSDSCIENSWRTKVDFRRGLSYLIFLHFPKNWHISNQRGKDWYLFLYIYLYM